MTLLGSRLPYAQYNERATGENHPDNEEDVINRALKQLLVNSGIDPDTVDAAIDMSSVLSTGSTTARSLAARFAEVVCIRDFFASGDSVNDWSAALGRALAISGHIYCPGNVGSAQTYPVQQTTDITEPVRIFGDQPGHTVFERNYSPSNLWDGVFSFKDGSSWSRLDNMTIRSKTGQTGGCLFSIKPTSSGTVGGYSFSGLDLTTTGTDTHSYDVYADGTIRTSAPVGIRGIHFQDCYFFGASVANLLLKGTLKVSLLGGLIDPAGGTSTVGILVDGTAGVPSQGIIIIPGDMYSGLSLGYAEDVLFLPGLFSGAIVNTANTKRFFGRGNATSVQTNFDSVSKFESLSDGQIYANTNIFPRSLNGTPTGTRKTSSTTSIGTVGAAVNAFAVPDSQTFTFTMTGSGLTFNIGLSSGEAAVVFVDNASATVTLVANPSTKFEASSTPGAGKVGIFKSAGSNVVSVKNGTGGSVTVSVVALGAVLSTTDPA